MTAAVAAPWLPWRDLFRAYARRLRGKQQVGRRIPTPRRRWHGGWLRKAAIEVDRETKAVRRLVIERDIPQHGSSTVTYTLVDSRTPDESKYRPEGRLTEPFRLLTRETQPDKRRELMTNWFGPAAERGIKTSETNPQ